MYVFQYFSYKPILDRLNRSGTLKSYRSREKLQNGAIKVLPGAIGCSFMPGQGPCYYGKVHVPMVRSPGHPRRSDQATSKK